MHPHTSIQCPFGALDGTRLLGWLLLGVALVTLLTAPIASGHVHDGASMPNQDRRATDTPDVAVFQVSEGISPDGIGSPLEPIARGLLYVALLLIIGVPLALAVVVRPVLGTEDRLVRRSLLLLTSASALLVLSVALLAVVHMGYGEYEPSLSGLGAFVGTRLGRIAVVQLLVTIGVFLVLSIGGRVRLSHRVRLGTVFVGGVLLAITVSLGSHSASQVAGTTGVLVDAGHVVGAAAWVGGLAALALLAVPELALLEPDAARRNAVRLIRRFSVVAVGAVGLAIATGLVLVAWHVPDLDALTRTAYGSVLSAKVLFVLVAIGLGGLNRFVIQRSLAGSSLSALADGGRSIRSPGTETVLRWFGWSVRIELAVFLLVLTLTGALTSLPTAAVADRATVEETDSITLSEQSSGIKIRIEVAPVQVGQNTLSLSFVRDGTNVETVRDVSIQLRYPEGNLTLPPETIEATDGGRYSSVVVFPTYGRWVVQVDARVDGDLVTEQFSVRIPSENTEEIAQQPSDRAETKDDRFAWLLRVGALLVGAGAILAVGRDLVVLKREPKRK